MARLQKETLALITLLSVFNPAMGHGQESGPIFIIPEVLIPGVEYILEVHWMCANGTPLEYTKVGVQFDISLSFENGSSLHCLCGAHFNEQGIARFVIPAKQTMNAQSITGRISVNNSTVTFRYVVPLPDVSHSEEESLWEFAQEFAQKNALYFAVGGSILLTSLALAYLRKRKRIPRLES